MKLITWVAFVLALILIYIALGIITADWPFPLAFFVAFSLGAIASIAIWCGLGKEGL